MEGCCARLVQLEWLHKVTLSFGCVGSLALSLVGVVLSYLLESTVAAEDDAFAAEAAVEASTSSGVMRMTLRVTILLL